MDGNEGSGEPRSGTRSVCDLQLAQVTAIGDDEGAWLDELQPGDLLFFRLTNNWLSRVIVKLDGYWSHSGIYVGEGKMAHAALGGVEPATLTKLVRAYPDGVGYSRPDLPVEVRNRAAERALKIESSTEGSRYSGRDLGIAFGLLARARLTSWLAELPIVGDGDADELEASTQLETPSRPPFESTCSGFAYECYADGEDKNHLEIVPAPGLHIEERRIVFGAGTPVLEALDPDQVLEGPFSETLENLMTMVKLVSQVGVGTIELALDDDGVDIRKGVSPADLWCSPTMAKRGFLTTQHETNAHDASADCG